MKAENGAQADAPDNVTLSELTRIFGRIGILSFGGPAGQIALMHNILVDEKRWLDEKRFLHALNFCMLLPGPEAMQLATYCGWLLRGVTGGLIAGWLFVLPGVMVLLGLSALYATLGDIPVVAGLLFGLKAAVLAIVFQALVRVSQRALKNRADYVIAIWGFLGLAVFNLPFPLVILAAALTGYFLLAENGAEEPSSTGSVAWQYVMRVSIWGAVFWLGPLALLLVTLGTASLYSQEAMFFSKAAMVTFGGAYAVLSYVAQQAVEVYGWLKPEEMLTGLGLAETTPGPLVLVLVFVGFMGAFRDPGVLDPLVAGLFGGLVTVWMTFIPCFIWVLLGAPFMEGLRGNARLAGALSAITAAVVGVIASLAIWFGVHVLFEEVGNVSLGPASLDWPVMGSANPAAWLIAGLAGLMQWRGFGLFQVLGLATLLGIMSAWV